MAPWPNYESVGGDSPTTSPEKPQTVRFRPRSATSREPAHQPSASESLPDAGATWPAFSEPPDVEPESTTTEALAPFEDDQNPLMWFRTETEGPGTGTSRRLLRWGLAAAVVALVAVGVVAGIRALRSAPVGQASGMLVLESVPAGAAVAIDGEPAGTTPLTLSLAAGGHLIVLEHGGARREVRRTIEPGVRIIEHVELASVVPSGGLRVTTRPPGASVSIDGVPRGVSPIQIDDLSAGAHTVVLASGQTTVEETVTVVAGVTSSLVVPIGAAVGVGYGWVSISSAVPFQVFEGGRLLGTSDTEQIMVAAGRHPLEIVNEALGFRRSETVVVMSGRVARVQVPVPNGVLNVNAVPWAEVFLDGQRIGETPIANLEVPIGRHDLEFRNPQLGSQRRTVTVVANTPTRVGVDFRR